MEIHHDNLSDIGRYLADFGSNTLDEYQAEFQNYLRLIRKFKSVEPGTNVLEIGIGTGWFPILCKMQGIACKGLEISPQLIEHARKLGRQVGIDPDLELANVEETDIGADCYDVVVASSVFEHIEFWEKALARIYKGLKPGGLLFFASTNKFSFTSGEYSFPLYGWLPDRWRYRLRIARQGADIMKLGIDFNQFRYPQLRRAFRSAGFRQIHDRVDIAEPTSAAKKTLVALCRRSGLAKALVLTFSDATIFLCVK